MLDIDKVKEIGVIKELNEQLRGRLWDAGRKLEKAIQNNLELYEKSIAEALVLINESEHIYDEINCIKENSNEKTKSR